MMRDGTAIVVLVLIGPAAVSLILWAILARIDALDDRDREPAPRPPAPPAIHVPGRPDLPVEHTVLKVTGGQLTRR